jgi:hypothetical protein
MPLSTNLTSIKRKRRRTQVKKSSPRYSTLTKQRTNSASFHHRHKHCEEAGSCH